MEKKIVLIENIVNSVEDPKELVSKTLLAFCDDNIKKYEEVLELIGELNYKEVASIIKTTLKSDIDVFDKESMILFTIAGAGDKYIEVVDFI